MSNAATVNASGSFLKFSGKTLMFVLVMPIFLIAFLLAMDAFNREDSKLKERDLYSNFGVGMVQSVIDYKEAFVSEKRLTNVRAVSIEFEKYYVVVYLANQDDGTLYSVMKGEKINSTSPFSSYKNVKVFKRIPTPSS